MKYLKIKDDVDLKELEKYGFIFGTYTIIKKITSGCWIVKEYAVDKEDRIITEEYFYDYSVEMDSTIYDLTMTNLVEVVEE